MSFGPQKAIVSEESLPPLTVFKDGTFGYRLRYRVVSADGNRFSHYSPTYTIRPGYEFQRPSGKNLSDVVILRQGPYVNVVWDSILVKNMATSSLIKTQAQYDIWLNWSKGEANSVWLPGSRVEGVLAGAIVPSFYEIVGTGGPFSIEEEPTQLSVEVYIRATEQSRENIPLLVYKLDNFNIEPPESPPAN